MYFWKTEMHTHICCRPIKNGRFWDLASNSSGPPFLPPCTAPSLQDVKQWPEHSSKGFQRNVAKIQILTLTKTPNPLFAHNLIGPLEMLELLELATRLGKEAFFAKSFRRMHWEWHWMLVHPVHFPLSLPAGRFGFSVGSENSPNCRGVPWRWSPPPHFWGVSKNTPNLWEPLQRGSRLCPTCIWTNLTAAIIMLDPFSFGQRGSNGLWSQLIVGCNKHLHCSK